MSTKKNKDILESISKDNYLRYTKEAIVNAMLKQEVAGQRVFYVFLTQQKIGLEIKPENMDKNQSDGIVGNAIIECKLNENEGGGPKKAYQELYQIIPNRLKNKGERLPYYRIYVELETFLVEVYDCHCHLIETFDWYLNPEKFTKYFNENEDSDEKKTYEYDLNDDNVDLVEVIQNIYKFLGVKEKIDAYKKLEEGVVGWFNPFDFKKVNINRLILNNDRMNEKYVQKVQGAFFTPPQYVKISTQYVKNAIKQSKIDGYDNYVIVDRCSGVGNLESKFEEEIYPHLILGTINEAEAFTANIRFGELANVNVIDALTENGVIYYKNKIEEFIKKNKVKKLAVIFLENPPYTQLNSNKDGGTGTSTTQYEKTWVHNQMEKGGQDLDEQFVFSAFKYFDIYSYIHYGPIKIWKTRHLIDKEVKEAYLCNRKYFNAGEAAVPLIHWSNKDKENKIIEFDSDLGGKFKIKKVFKTISELYSDEGKENGICVVEARNFSFSSPRLTGSLNDDGKYGKKWVSAKNLLKVLPLFCASRDEVSEKGGIGSEKDYRIIDTVYKTSDGGDKYQNDKDFLQNCLLWSLCSHFNQCSSDGKIWEWGEQTLKKELKQGQIWTVYKELVDKTKLNGLYNIENYNKLENGKLWKEHSLYPKVNLLKNLLQQFYVNEIRNKLLEYELLK